jgi:membrane protein
MALLSDVPKVIRHYGAWGFTKRVWQEIEEDHLFTWSAALAYSWLFALFPFLIFLMTLLPYLPADIKQHAPGEIKQTIEEIFPSQAADTVWKNVEPRLTKLLSDDEGQKQANLAPRLISLGLALWAASGGMAMTMAALDMCYEVTRGRPFYFQRPLAIGVTVAVTTLVLMVVCMLPVGAFVHRWLASEYPSLKGTGLLLLFDVLRWSLGVLFLSAALSILYQKGPSIRRRWTWLSPGSVFCVVVWIGLGLAFKLYVTRYGKYNDTYGTVGGVVVLLLFFYIDAVVLLVGAQINSEIDFQVLGVDRGSRDYRAAEALHRPRRSRRGPRGSAAGVPPADVAVPPGDNPLSPGG